MDILGNGWLEPGSKAVQIDSGPLQAVFSLLVDVQRTIRQRENERR